LLRGLIFLNQTKKPPGLKTNRTIYLWGQSKIIKKYLRPTQSRYASFHGMAQNKRGYGKTPYPHILVSQKLSL